MPAKYLTLLLLLSAFPCILNAQKALTTPIFKIISKEQKNDTSIYDACIINDSTVWFAGRHGTIHQLNTQTHQHKKIHQLGNNLIVFSLYKTNTNKVLAGTSEGKIFLLDITNEKKQETNLHLSSKSCIYSIHAINDTVIYACGGRTGIALAKKTIPFGFIYKSTNGGLDWKRVKSIPLKMAWHLTSNSTDKVYASCYRPNKTLVYCSKNQGKFRVTTRQSGLFHDITTDEKNLILSGGKNMHLNKGGIVYSAQLQAKINTEKFIWDCFTNQNLLIATCSDGRVLITGNEFKEAIEYQIQQEKNLYKILPITSSTFYLFGSDGIIVQLKF